METKEVYMTTEQIEERKAKIAAIEGLEELKAAYKAWIDYHQAKMEFERGEREFEDVPAYNTCEVATLRTKYPRAAAYLDAEQWISTGVPIKVRLGSRAMEKILDGEDPAAALDEMRKGRDAFYTAQEG